MGGPAVDGWSSPRDDSPSSAVRMAPPVARPGWGPLPAVAPTALLTVEDCVSSMVWLFPSGVSWKSVCVVCGCPRAYGGVWDVLEAVISTLLCPKGWANGERVHPRHPFNALLDRTYLIGTNLPNWGCTLSNLVLYRFPSKCLEAWLPLR